MHTKWLAIQLSKNQCRLYLREGARNPATKPDSQIKSAALPLRPQCLANVIGMHLFDVGTQLDTKWTIIIEPREATVHLSRETC